MHRGDICNQGLNCDVFGGNRNLLDFISVAIDGHGNALMPCGRCRQLLWENGGPELLVDTPLGVQTMAEVLPQAFGPEHLRQH